MEPHLLITNDDGIQAAGIEVLAARLSSLGRVVVVAPESPQSAVGHSITLHKPLRVHQLKPGWYVCSGSPVDCVYLGVNALFKDDRPTVVVSGINRGPNLGTDVLYSGTVSGAMEGRLLGIPSLAVSQTMASEQEFAGGDGAELDFGPAAELAAKVVSAILDGSLKSPLLLNLNVPYDYDPQKGFRIATLGRRRYGNNAFKRIDPRGRPYYWIGGDVVGFDAISGSDCVEIDKGFATLTPVRADLTDTARLERLEEWADSTGEE